MYIHILILGLAAALPLFSLPAAASAWPPSPAPGRAQASPPSGCFFHGNWLVTIGRSPLL